MALVASTLSVARAGTDVSDPFGPYLTGRPPRVLRALGEETRGGVKLTRVVFHSRDVATPARLEPSEVYAVIARPTTPGPHPGLLVLHGGGGGAEVGRAAAWAEAGYVAVAPDLPGIGNSAPGKDDKMPHSSGPWRGKYGERRFVGPDVTASTIFDGVLAAAQALQLLRAQPDVDVARVGVTGISWGGYATTMVCGLAGPDVRAAFSVYGCGYYDRGTTFEKELAKLSAADARAWLAALDAGRRAGNIRAAFFIAAATNDNWFYPPAVTATLADVADANHLFAPNANHNVPVPGGTTAGSPSTQSASTGPGWLAMEVDFFAWHLKGNGSPLPRVRVVSTSPSDGGLRARFDTEGVRPAKAVELYYSLADGPWTKRNWVAVPATPTGTAGAYVAVIPADAVAAGADWFVALSDDRPVTVSSELQSTRR